MKKILKQSIVNIPNTPIHDSIFSFDTIEWDKQSAQNSDVEIIFMSDLLREYENQEMLEKAKTKPASYSNVYAPKDELAIFTELFQKALGENKKIHIVGITLKEELEMIETYYHELGFFDTDINCFTCDFSQALVTVSCKIENIMYRGSDYKRMGKSIFFNPPIRESGQVKALFKGINRGVIAGLYIGDEQRDNIKIDSKNRDNKPVISTEIQIFLQQQIIEEHILPLTLGKILKYNLEQIGITGTSQELIIQY